MFYIQQTHENGCGFACLKMMLANIRKDKRFLFLPEKEEKTYNYKELIGIAKQHGLNLCGFKVENKTEITKQKIFPLILRISPEEGVYHAILLTKIKHGIVHYLDPAEGPLTMALHKFVKVWDGTGLLIEEDNGGPFGYIIEEPNQNKNYLISSVIQIVSGIFCVLGIYFVNRNINIVFPVSFLSAFIITEMVLKIFLFKTIKEKDNFYAKDLKIDKSKFGLFFEQLEKYKTLSSVNPVNFFTHLIICFFIIFVSILNSVNNLVLILLPLCLVLIDFFIYVPWRKKKDLDIQLNEAQLRQSEDIESYKTKLSKIHSKAYSLGGVEVSKR